MAQAVSVPSPNPVTNTDAKSQRSTTKTYRLNVPADRRYFIGGSDARIIMGNDEAALLSLWQEKRGEAEPSLFRIATGRTFSRANECVE